MIAAVETDTFAPTLSLRKLPGRLRRAQARFSEKYLSDVVFVHINKTAGTSVANALGIPSRHLTALEHIEDLGQKRWQSRFKFTFVRNPWDKVASHYHYRVKTNQTGLGDRSVPFNEWVRLAYGDCDPKFDDNPKMFMPQVKWMSDAEGRILVDFIGRFESLDDDFSEICRRIGRRASLPHLLKSSRGD